MFSSNSSQVSSAYNYIEDVFSTYLYTGNGTSQTITNNIDLSTKGGLVWIKNRSAQDFGNTRSHWLFDSARTAGYGLFTNSTSAQSSAFAGSIPFSTAGFSINTGDANLNGTGTDPYTYASWTFRKQPKFFDIVTFTTDVNGYALVSHNLGSTPGCVIVKTTGIASDWFTFHKDLNGGTNPNRYLIKLNSTAAQSNPLGANDWIVPTSTTLTFPSGGWLNGNATHVAYLFASNAGGFGLTGTDNVITCGSFTTDGSGNATVNLGYEPQWLLFKPSSGGGTNWRIIDVMRGFTAGATDAVLIPNTTGAEISVANGIGVTSTGFTGGSNFFDPSTDVIYIAIRRGPMKVPTVGTSVFSPILQSNANTPPRTISGAGFAPDLMWQGCYQYANGSYMYDRLRGQVASQPCYTDAEASVTSVGASFTMDGISYTSTGSINNNGNAVDWFMLRAPSFFDEVCYTGTGSATTINHNLGVVPEMMIVKCRSTGGTNRGWWTYVAPLGNTQALYLNTSDNAQTASIWNNTTPTSTVFSIDGTYLVNGSGATYVAYLFATCAGVSKVGSYSGTGATQTINCGFTGGARFVLIKRTDSTGDWYVWDTARGMVSGTDPSLLMNSAAVQVNANSVYTATTGFQIVSTAAGINASGGSYIFLAIA